MSFRAQRGSEDDEVLGDGGVNDVHGTHGATGIVEHPLGGVRKRIVVIECDNALLRVLGVCLVNGGKNVGDHAFGGIGRSSNRGLGELMEGFRVEDVVSVLESKPVNMLDDEAYIEEHSRAETVNSNTP